jgi:hypothetical protein
VLYADIVEKILYRGLDKLTVVNLSEIAKHLCKATNVHKAGFGFYEEMERHFHKEMVGGRISFEELCRITENILPNNIGSTKF